jgi:hypothetical protein
MRAAAAILVVLDDVSHGVGIHLFIKNYARSCVVRQLVWNLCAGTMHSMFERWDQYGIKGLNVGEGRYFTPKEMKEYIGIFCKA